MSPNAPSDLTTRCVTTACLKPPWPDLGPPRSVRTPTRIWRPRPQRCCTPSPATTPIDGNKRLALAAVIAFCGLNGRRLTLTNDAAYDLVISVASGNLDTVEEIAAVLRPAARARG